MAEKFINRIEKSNTQPDTTEDTWVSNAITNLQKESALSNEEAAMVIYSRTLSDLKALVSGNESILSVFADNLDKKINKTIDLSLILPQVIGKVGVEQITKLANTNKFRPIKISVEQGEVLREKMAYVEVTGVKEMGDMEAREIATCKKIVEVLLTRIFISDGAQELANISELVEKNPELAADLGKLLQATELIRLHRNHIEKIMKRDAERREIIAKAKGRAAENVQQTVLYAKELFGGTKYSVEEPKRVFGGFHRRIKESEDRWALYKTTDETIN